MAMNQAAIQHLEEAMLSEQMAENYQEMALTSSSYHETRFVTEMAETYKSIAASHIAAAETILS